MFNFNIASGFDDGYIKVWDPNTSECVLTLKGHTDSVYGLEVVNGEIISGGWDSRINIWSAHTGECLKTLSRHNFKDVKRLVISL